MDLSFAHSDIDFCKMLREATKKLFFLVDGALRGGEGKGRTTKKKLFYEDRKKSEKNCNH